MAREPLTPSQKRYKRRGLVIQLVAAAIFVAGVFAVKPWLGRPARFDDLLATIAGFLMLQMAVIQIVSFTVAPKSPEHPRLRLTHVATSVIAGMTMLLPIVGEGLIDPAINFAIILVMTAVSCWCLWRIWGAAGEFDRTVMKEVYALNYLVLCTALIVYAAGERLGVLGGVTAWGGLAFATFIALPVTIWISARRGITQIPQDE